MKIQLNDGGRLTDVTGYGNINRALYKQFQEMGHEVGHSLAPIRGDIAFYACPPYSFKDLDPDSFNVGLTMTERESIAAYGDWPERCNAMDLIITPSQWNKRVFQNNGITTRIEVAPIGLDLDTWPQKPYKFLSVIDGFGSHSSRWNWQELIDAYKMIAREEISWTIRARETSGELPDLPGVTFITEELTEEQMRQLFLDADCYLCYSREGWGFPIWQAMACGLDIIAPNYGVQREYLANYPKCHLFNGGHLSDDNLKFVEGDVLGLEAVMLLLSQPPIYDWPTVAKKYLDIIDDARK